MQNTGVNGGRVPSAFAGTPPPRRRTVAGYDVVALSILTAISFVVGWVFNLTRSTPLPWVYVSRAQAIDRALGHLQEIHTTPQAPAELPHEIRLDDFQPFVSSRQGLVLDARPAVFYGQGHIPGALSLPRETFAEDYPRLRSVLEPSKDRPIAIYCSGADCPDSQLLADALTKLGYRRLLIYTSGWEEWSQTGLPQEGAAPTP